MGDFYVTQGGDRCGTVYCPFGHKWTTAIHIEDLTPDQMKQRMDEWVKSMATIVDLETE